MGAGLRGAPDPPQRHEAEFSKRTSLVKSGVLESTMVYYKITPEIKAEGLSCV